LLFVARWNITDEPCEPLLERFMQTKEHVPEGVHVLGRWHRKDGRGGFMVMEASSMKPVSDLAYDWNDLLFVEIEQVVDDQELPHVIDRLKDSGSNKDPSDEP